MAGLLQHAATDDPATYLAAADNYILFTWRESIGQDGGFIGRHSIVDLVMEGGCVGWVRPVVDVCG